MTQRRYWLMLGPALLVGSIAGAAWPPPPLPRLPAESTSWSLPSLADIARHQPEDLAKVTAGMRWNGTNGPIQQARSSWLLAGILTDTEQAVLVTPTSDPRKPVRVAAGETLPDGSKLIAVSGDRISTEHEKCITTYQLFHAQPVERSQDCAAAEVSDQGTHQ